MTHILISSATRLLCCCLLLLLASSCVDTSSTTDFRADQERQRRAAQQEENRRLQAQYEQNMAALTSINHRIQIYQQKSEEWKQAQAQLDPNRIAAEKINQGNACQMQTSDLLNAYLNLQQRITGGQSATEGPIAEALIQLNQQDMTFLEGHCNALLDEIEAVVSVPSEESPIVTAEESAEIKQAFHQADYTKVINLYNRQAQMQDQIPGAQTTLLYAQALIKNYQENVARDVLQNLLQQTQFETSKSDVYAQTLRLLADLDFASGSYEQARQNYEHLVRIAVQNNKRDEWASVQLTALQPEGMGFEEAREYSQLLKNYLAYTPKRDGYAVSGMAESFLLNYPASRLVPNANQIHRANRQQAENWLNRGIQEVRDKVDQRHSTDALSTSGANGAFVGEDKQLDALLQGKYDTATALLAEKNYDQAITVFQDLLGTSYQDQARSRIEEASKLAAEEARKQAAELYVRAANAGNQENKKKLLNSSRELLQNALNKYPQSGLNDKVQRNLKSIERELRSMETVSEVY